MKYHVWLKAESPLVITAHRATGNQLDTLRSVPGTTWRGALARSVIADLPVGNEPHLEPRFRTLFLEGRVRFGCLLANGERPFPLSARVCGEHEEHAVRDLLLLRKMGATLPRTCDELVGLAGTCGGKLKPHEGLVRLENRRPLNRDPQVRVTAHTAIANATLRVREEQFYTTSVVERGTSFQGEVWVQDEAAGRAFEAACAASPWLFVGRGGTRGLGHMSLQFKRETPKRKVGLAEFEAMNRPFRDSRSSVFTVTLDSPCVVFDQWGLARPYLLPCDIEEAARLPAGALAAYSLADWHSRMIRISGWNAQAHLPKSDVLAIAPGSAFLFHGNVADEAGRRREYERLAVAFGAVTGIGERWAEGYGEARFCDPIHYQEAKA